MSGVLITTNPIISFAPGISCKWLPKDHGRTCSNFLYSYQPVSYKLHSRMGTRAELRAMIQACRTAGVRVYADAVANHMVGQGTGKDVKPTLSCCP